LKFIASIPSKRDECKEKELKSTECAVFGENPLISFREFTALWIGSVLTSRESQNKMELTGKLKLIRDEQTFASGFKKREFVITTEEQYPNDILFELQKDKTGLVMSYQPGERIKISFDIRGREWQDKYFNNLVAWRVERADQGSTGSERVETFNQAMPISAPVQTAPAADDDLPF